MKNYFRKNKELLKKELITIKEYHQVALKKIIIIVKIIIVNWRKCSNKTCIRKAFKKEKDSTMDVKK